MPRSVTLHTDSRSLPISYEDAIPLLNTLKGQGTPASELGPLWEGGLKYLGVEYWTGPGDRDVNFVNEVDTKVTPIWSMSFYVLRNSC